MAPRRRPNPIGQNHQALQGTRTIHTKVVQGEVDVALYRRCVQVLDAHGYTLREMVEWGCHRFLEQFDKGTFDKGAGAA